MRGGSAVSALSYRVALVRARKLAKTSKTSFPTESPSQPMALRIAKGLFRLWLVLSVLWFGMIGIMSRELPWSTFRHVPPVEASDVGQESPSTIRAVSADGVVHEFPAGTELAIIDRVIKDYTLQRRIQFAANAAIIPPLFVLMAGWAFVWACRGFLATDGGKG
jgi:hypothetical protein